MAHRRSDVHEGHEHVPVFAAPGHDHSHCAETVLARAETLSAARGVRFTPIRRQVLEALAATHQPIGAYEIHIGRTEGKDCARPFAFVGGNAEGAVSEDGRVQGSYLHGLFAFDSFRRAYLARLGVAAANESYGSRVETALDALADHIEQHLDLEGLLALAR